MSDMPYVLRKNGMFYAYNNCGYVSRVEVAELYSEDYAKAYPAGHDDVTAHPVTDFVTDAGHIDNVIEHLTAIRDALTTSDQGGE